MPLPTGNSAGVRSVVTEFLAAMTHGQARFQDFARIARALEGSGRGGASAHDRIAASLRPARAVPQPSQALDLPMTTPSKRRPGFLAVAEVAQTLRVSVKTVRRWIEQGELRVHRLGRQLRISEEDLSAFINRGRV